MTNEYYRIKDSCRQGLLKYLADAFSFIPDLKDPKILDIGCGTGVPTLWLAANCNGKITAIDTNKEALNFLNQKIITNRLQNKITTINISFFDMKSEPDHFDLILAEGFLNVVGFETGFLNVIRILKRNGYFLIHDEYSDHSKKCEFIAGHDCTLAGTIFLDDKIWWNNYYIQLETEIKSTKIKHSGEIFKSELQEIGSYKADPTPFRSIYYIVRKN